MATKKHNPGEATAEDVAPQDAVHALELLAGEVGEAPRGGLDAIIAGTSDADLVKVGRTILSSRIVTDTSRIYRTAWEFYRTASDEQKKRLRGFSRPLLAVAVREALKLHRMDQELAGQTSASEAAQAAQSELVNQTMATAIALRDQAYDALRDVAGGEAQRREVDAAFGTAASADTLARGLEALAATLRRWMEGEDEALVERIALGNLDAAYAEELEKAAQAVRKAAAHAQRRAGGKVTQAMLDRADGVNVLLLGQVLRAFEGAHGRDPTVPRLVPISTRRLFNRKSAKKRSDEPPKEGGDGNDGGAQ